MSNLRKVAKKAEFSIATKSSFTRHLFQELPGTVVRENVSFKNSFDSENKTSKKPVSSFSELVDDMKSTQGIILPIPMTKTCESSPSAAKSSKPDMFASSSDTLNDSLVDHSFTRCGHVCPLQERLGSTTVEQKVHVTSNHMAWYLSSQFVLDLLVRKSNADIRGHYTSVDGMTFTIVGEQAVVENVIELIRKLLFSGLDCLMGMPDII